MNAAHHPPDELLVRYAAGETPEAISLMIACHATLCPRCRHQLDSLDAVGGALIEQLPGAPLPADALERALDGLDSPSETSSPAPSVLPDLGVPLPRPLLRYLGDAPTWKRIVPGVAGIKLPAGAPGTLLRLVRLRPGMTIPLHDHAGPELTMVFSGGLIEPDRSLHRGDFALRQPGECHVQRVAAGEPCIALTFNEGPLLPLTWLGRLLTLVARE